MPYHAGMSDKERSAAQDSWMSGKTPVVVATVAFVSQDVAAVCVSCVFVAPEYNC